MKTIEETRFIRLLMLRDELGSIAELSRVTGISYAQISQWANKIKKSGTDKVRNISSESARLIEKKLDKPYGWFDQPVFGKGAEETKEIDAIMSILCSMSLEELKRSRKIFRLLNSRKD